MTLGLCRGRHDIPGVTEYVFDNTVNPLDVQGLQATADKYIAQLIRGKGGCHINLYVTGLSVALVSVINACNRYSVMLTLWHYDRDSGKYYPQYVSNGSL